MLVSSNLPPSARRKECIATVVGDELMDSALPASVSRGDLVFGREEALARVPVSPVMDRALRFLIPPDETVGIVGNGVECGPFELEGSVQNPASPCAPRPNLGGAPLWRLWPTSGSRRGEITKELQKLAPRMMRSARLILVGSPNAARPSLPVYEWVELLAERGLEAVELRTHHGPWGWRFISLSHTGDGFLRCVKGWKEWMLIARKRPGGPPDPTSASRPAVSVILAMRNERGNVEPVLRNVVELPIDKEIIVVEGGSTDGTAEEVERLQREHPEWGIHLLRQSGVGVGRAIVQGFEAARGAFLLLMEGDGTSEARELLPIYERIAVGAADFVNGSRMLNSHAREAMPLLNRCGNRFFARWLGRLTGRPATTDVLCGLKGIRRDAFQRIRQRWGSLGREDPFSDFELFLGAARLGLVMEERAVEYRPRRYGVSKTRVWGHGWALTRLAWSATRRWTWPS